MARPSHVDSQRILSLMDEFVDKVELLNILDLEYLEELLSDKEDLESRAGREVTECLARHQRALEAFDRENPASDKLLKDFYDVESNVSEEAKEVAKELKRSTWEVLHSKDEVKQAIKYKSAEAWNDLRKLMLKKLMTPIEEERSRENQLEEVALALRKAKEEEAAWTEKLTNLRKQRDEGRENRKKRTKDLMAEIDKVSKDTEQQKNRIEKTTASKNDKIIEEFGKKIKDLETEEDNLRNEITELRAKNKELEDSLVSKKQKTQTTKIEDKIREYDKEMEDLSEHLERETRAFEENKKALEMVEDHIRQIRLERKRMMEEQRRDEEKRRKYQNNIKQKDAAAEFIQAHWKGLKLRQEYEKLKKQKLKKRGKKKK